MRRGILFALFAILGGSCAHESLRRRVYIGEVIGVQAAVGNHFSPAKGLVPLTFISVRVDDEQRTKSVRLRVALMEIYSPAVFGTVGDRISFRYFSRLPFDGQVSFREIGGYRIIEKG